MLKMKILYGYQFHFVIVCLCCIVCVTSQLYAGDECYHQVHRLNGICKPVHECKSAEDDLRNRRNPQPCGFQGSAAIVCCVEKATTTSTTTTTRKPVTNVPDRPLPVGEKSKRACQTYKKLAYKLSFSPLPISDGPEEEPICPWEPDAQIVIAEGDNATKGEFPHMALIGYGTWPSNYVWGCGGSLISEKFVLTAGHCLISKKDGNASFVRLGDTNYASSDDDKDVQQINIKELHRHPNYKFSLNYHDIALLELEKPAKLNIYVKPICLYTESTTEPRGIITGWGNTENGTKSQMLLKAVVGSFPYDQCSQTYSEVRLRLPSGLDENLQMCYGSNRNRKDTCQGDSGGPIQVYAKGVYCSYSVFGVASFGISCGNRGIPGIYVRVSSYIEWIEKTVWP